jgi:hypothetical protein
MKKTSSKKTKKMKFDHETVHLDDFDDYRDIPAFEGYTGEPDMGEIEKYLEANGWSYEGHWFSSDSDAGSHSAYALKESVNKGHTQGLIVDTDDDDVYWFSK